MDQDDNYEKSRQLPLMSRIYNVAKRVCVWLGEGDQSTADAFHMIDIIRDIGDFNHFVEEKTSVDEWNAFVKLLMELWFSRRWVSFILPFR